jgi:hypothetical protein
MLHALSVTVNHSANSSDVMYQYSNNWSDDGRLISVSRSQIIITNGPYLGSGQRCQAERFLTPLCVMHRCALWLTSFLLVEAGFLLRPLLPLLTEFFNVTDDIGGDNEFAFRIFHFHMACSWETWHLRHVLDLW